MSTVTELPFNITLFNPTDERLQRIRPTRVVDIYDGQTKNFHEDGLYSLYTFGDPQSRERDTRFSYIELHTEIFHPLVFRHILRLKSFYGDILSGKKYARFDTKLKDFEPADESTGETGYGFFYRHFMDLRFIRNESSERQLRIDFIEKFRGRHFLKRHLIIPAGLRELEISESGRPVEDEINEAYRRILAIARALPATGGDINDSVYDRPRLNLQRAAEEVFEILYRLLSGKKGFIQGKYASRRVFDGTRNVITSLDAGSDHLNDPRQVGAMSTQFGLFQVMRGVLPLTVHRLKTGFLATILEEGSRTARLVDPKTLRSIHVELSSQSQDRWTTIEGLKKNIAFFASPSLRLKPIRIEGKYLGLVYDDGNSYRFFHDLDELPDTLDRKKVRALTWGELYYHSLWQDFQNIYAVVTRYPVTGLGSCYISRIYVKTTVTGRKLYALNADWAVAEGQPPCPEYPTVESTMPWVDAMSPSSCRLKLLGADFDGDMMGATFVYSEEARQECDAYLSSKEALLGSDGKLFNGVITDICEWVFLNLSS